MILPLINLFFIKDCPWLGYIVNGALFWKFFLWEPFIHSCFLVQFRIHIERVWIFNLRAYSCNLWGLVAVMSLAFKGEHFCHFLKCLDKVSYILYINFKNNHIEAKMKSFIGHSGLWANCSGKLSWSWRLFCVSRCRMRPRRRTEPLLAARSD